MMIGEKKTCKEIMQKSMAFATIPLPLTRKRKWFRTVKKEEKKKPLQMESNRKEWNVDYMY